MELTLNELQCRRQRFCTAMDVAFPGWGTAIIASKVNQYYFTGSMQNAILLIFRDGNCEYYIRQSHERAQAESPLQHIYPMGSYKSIAERHGANLGNTFMEAEVMPYAMLQRLRKHLQMENLGGCDAIIRNVRSVKSEYELHWMRLSGQQHSRLMLDEIPALLREGISEAELVGEIYSRMMHLGHHGLSRFNMFDTEMGSGQFAFGENSLQPTFFDGPGGSKGYSAASPIAGDPSRKLKKGDLVFVDAGFGMNGYHTDTTQVYMFGCQPPQEAKHAQMICMDIQNKVADMLRPSAIPSEIYGSIMNNLPGSFEDNFMGFGSRQVKFLGHGIGLHVDESPVIAKGFDQPLEQNMAFAIEPKKGLAGIGMVGVEDTYIVTPSGGECITGGGRDIVVVE